MNDALLGALDFAINDVNPSGDKLPPMTQLMPKFGESIKLIL
jgi:hypothetical protein